MNVSNTIKDAYKSGSYAKVLTITFPNISYTVPDDEVYYESMTLKEAIFDGDSFEIVGCIASMFEVQIRDTGRNLKGELVTVSIALEDISNSDIPLFVGYVDAVDKTAQKKMQKITAYDALYSKGAIDVASWYNNLSFPITLANFRSSLFNYIGISQVSTSLPNDSVTINKEYAPNTMKALSVIKSICQINGVFGIINRYGNFEYRVLNMSQTAESVTYYKDMDYKDYEINPVDKLTIRQTTDDSGVTVGSGNNEYIIQGNMFTYNLSVPTITGIANRMYSSVYNIEYIPFEASNNGYPWIECGNNCLLNYQVYDFENSTEETDVYTSVNVFVFNRTMKGIQDITDTYNAEGKELQREFISDISENLTVLQQTIDKIARQMSTEVTTYRNASIITIADGRTADVADLVYEADEGNTVIFHEEISLEISATESLSSGIYSEGDILVTARYYVNGYRITNHISEGLLREGKNILHLMQFWEAGEKDINRVQVKLTVNGGAVTIQKLHAQAYITVKQSDYNSFGIEVTRMPNKTTYELGDQLDYTGLVVSKVYFDDTTSPENITSQCRFSPTEWSTVTTTDMIEVNITYTETNELGETKTFDTMMYLNTQYLVAISVERDPDKDEYWVGETLDLTGIQVIADYVDGTTKDVTADCIYSPDTGATLTSVDSGEINISYTERGITETTICAVVVKEVIIEEIKVTTPPNKMVYYAGEELDLTGIVVTAFYNDDHTEIITNDCEFSPDDGDVLTGENSVVEISYQEQGTSTDPYVNILEPIVHVPTGLEVTTNPTKTKFKEGESIDLTGVQISLVWDDGTKTDVTSSCTFSPADGTVVTPDTEPAVNVSYTYLGETYETSIELDIVFVEGIEVTSEPNKTSYYENEQLNLTGVEIRANWSDDTSEDVTSSCTFSPADGTTLTENNSSVGVSYTYAGRTHTTEIGISVEPIELIDLRITSYPSKTSYSSGEALNLNGLVITAYFNNNTSSVVTSQCSYSPSSGAILYSDITECEASYTYKDTTMTVSIPLTVTLTSLRYFYTNVDSANHIIYITALKQSEMEEDNLTTLNVPTSYEEGNRVHWDIVIQ